MSILECPRCCFCPTCETPDDYADAMREIPEQWTLWPVAGGSEDADPENPYNFEEVPL